MGLGPLDPDRLIRPWTVGMQLDSSQRAKSRALDFERDAVLLARREGWSWQDIAARLGISYQATMKKYAAIAAADKKENAAK